VTNKRSKKLADLSPEKRGDSGRARYRYTNVRRIEREYFSVHHAVYPAYEAFLLLHPQANPLSHRAEWYRPKLTAVARSQYVQVVDGFADYLRLPADPLEAAACFIDKLPEREARDPDTLLEIAWDYVFRNTPWRALSNRVLVKFYECFFQNVPESVLANYGCIDQSRAHRSRVGPQAFTRLTGISRKTLNRLCKKNRESPIAHISHDTLVKKFKKGDDDE
jgi:hypothetical protein